MHTERGNTNMKIRTCTAAAIIAASSFAASVNAQPITDSFTYQGTLQDGGALANGLYDITFLVYDAEVGGSTVPGGSAIVNNVAVVDGLFTTEIDFGVTGQVFNTDEDLWLELQVAPAGQPSPTTLSPRTALTPATRANYALRSGTTLTDAFRNGNTIQFVPVVGLPLVLTGAPVVNMENSAGQTGISMGFNFFQNPYLQLQTNQGLPSIRMDKISSGLGGGGLINITRNDQGEPGILLEGNSAGSQAPKITLDGQSTIVLDASTDADASVQLPVNAISSTEILNETGAAESENSSFLSLTSDSGVIDLIDSVTLNAPADGYALIFASGEVDIDHGANGPTSIEIGVSDSPNDFNSNTDLEFRISGASAPTIYWYPFTSHAIYPVSEGANTFYFLGDLGSSGGSTASVSNRQLTAIYIPTAYGNVSRDPGPDLPDHMTPISAPMNAYDILAEQNASLQADVERQQRELEAMQAQMEQLKQEMRQEMRRQLEQQRD
jgi:hypothetical protein